MSTNKIRKTGLPPGSLIYTGVQKSDQIHKEFIRYNADHLEVIPFDSTPDPNPNFHYWLDVRGIHNPQEIEEIGKRFGMDPLQLGWRSVCQLRGASHGGAGAFHSDRNGRGGSGPCT